MTRHLVGVQRGPLELARQQEVAGDGDLVVLGVAVEGDQLHAVQQRRGDLLDHVGGGDEQHVGEVQVELEVVVAEGVVLRRVEHLEQGGRRVAAASPAPTLSTSSSSTTGFIEPASLTARTMRPGSAPTYVRRWPRISASSRTPPRATRTKRRPSARATDSPSEVLPTPGGPASRITAPEPRPPTTCSPRSARRAPDREVLHDPLLDLVEAVVVGVEDLAGPDDVVVVVGALVPRQLEHGVEPGADPGRLGALVAGALELVDLLAARPSRTASGTSAASTRAR